MYKCKGIICFIVVNIEMRLELSSVEIFLASFINKNSLTLFWAYNSSNAIFLRLNIHYQIVKIILTMNPLEWIQNQGSNTILEAMIMTQHKGFAIVE